MTTVVLAALVQVLTLGADQPDFDRACQQSLATRRPLVVLVGASWCAACQTMQKSIVPQVKKTGGLKNVIFIYVDFDQQRQLASRLIGGRSIPQLIRFDQTPSGWKNKRLIGARSLREVHDFINAGLIDVGKVSKGSTTARPQMDSHKPASGKTIPTTPAASQSRADSSVSALGGRQWVVEPSEAEKAEKPPHRTAFFKRLFQKNKNRHDNTAL